MTPRLISVADNLETTEIVEAVKTAVVGISCKVAGGYSVGSGVAIAEGGYVLTNHHVIEGAYNITLYLANNDTSSASVLWSDSALDLAVLQSNLNLPYLETLNSSNLKVGEDVIAIGTPLSLQFKHTVTKGIVSALNRTLEIGNIGGTTTLMQNLIQHDASINPGNSGGPLINSAGKVVGINTLKASDAEGIAFAIPIEIGSAISKKLTTNANHTVPKLGMFGYDAELANFNGHCKTSTGVYIEDVKTDTLFFKSGIKSGDIILAVNDTKIKNMTDFRQQLYSFNSGDLISLTILRDNSEQIIKVLID